MVLVHWLLSALTVMLTAYLVPGIKIRNFVAALWAAVVLGLVNATFWPFLVFLTIPITLITFGIFLFVVNGFALKIVAWLTPGFSIDGFIPAILGSVVLSAISWLVQYLYSY